MRHLVHLKETISSHVPFALAIACKWEWAQEVLRLAPFSHISQKTTLTPNSSTTSPSGESLSAMVSTKTASTGDISSEIMTAVKQLTADVKTLRMEVSQLKKQHEHSFQHASSRQRGYSPERGRDKHRYSPLSSPRRYPSSPAPSPHRDRHVSPSSHYQDRHVSPPHRDRHASLPPHYAAQHASPSSYHHNQHVGPTLHHRDCYVSPTSDRRDHGLHHASHHQGRRTTEWPSNRFSGERYGLRSSTDHLPSSGDHHVSFVDEDVDLQGNGW